MMKKLLLGLLAGISLMSLYGFYVEHYSRRQAAETEQSHPPSHHASDTPVGTGNAIVSKTFAIANTVKFPFEVPAHAAMPLLHGKYRSFVQSAGSEPSDENADVDFLLMNDQQYADFLRGRPADVVYSVDSSHDQDVHFGLPASRDKPVKYYLVFRNPSNQARKIVRADFRVDF